MGIDLPTAAPTPSQDFIDPAEEPTVNRPRLLFQISEKPVLN
jgi:hypothetical protein